MPGERCAQVKFPPVDLIPFGQGIAVARQEDCVIEASQVAAGDAALCSAWSTPAAAWSTA